MTQERVALEQAMRFVGPGLDDLFLPHVAAREWFEALGYTDSWQRLRLFIELAPLMTAEERAQTLAEIWSICDGGFWDWRDVLVGFLKQVGYMGDMPRPTAPLTLYRAVKVPRHRRGLSWSTERAVARGFPARSRAGRGRRAYLYASVVPPEAVLAGFTDRAEDEYVVDPDLITSIRLLESYDWLAELGGSS